METVNNPHDKLFRETWSHREEAVDFLTRYLPHDVSALIDLETLEICKDSFISKALRDTSSDLLYTVDIGNSTGYVYVLFEHKSYRDSWIHLQLLEYMISIWRLYLKQQKKKKFPIQLPIIIPIVLCHGEREWTVSPSFAELMSGPVEALNRYIPDFDYILRDLTRDVDDEIQGTALSRIVMLLFKHIHDPDILDQLPAIFDLMRTLLNREGGLHTLEMLLRYVFSAIEENALDQVTHIAEAALKGDIIMTIAERLHNEGKTEGMQQGYERGLVEAIEFGISLKFGDDAMQAIMPMIRSIHDLTRLQSIKDAVKQAQDLAQVTPLLGV